jgi:hypothetical protein
LLVSLPRATATLVGRGPELQQLDRGLADVAVAVICGVPGVGKSTLALAHGASWPGPATYLELTAGTSISHVVELLYRRFGVVRDELPFDDEARLDGLWALLDDIAALVVLDDLHHLASDARIVVIATASRRLQSGRLIATSRELLPIAAGMPDRLQLRLEGLSRGDAEQLWKRMKQLYGPAGDFEVAWRRSLGNPYLLRQAHVAIPNGDHPLVAIVQSLDPDERRAAGGVALSHLPLPRSILVGLLPARSASATLDRLMTRLILDVTADAAYVMHDAMRAAITAQLDDAVVRELRTALLAALPDSGFDAATIMQESARHLRALDRHAEVATLVLDAGPGLIRDGATATVLDELDALPDAVCGPTIQLLRARALARSIGQTRRAYEDLGRLAAVPGALPAVRLCFATAATMYGELAAAEQALRGLLDGEVSPELRTKAHYCLAWVLSYRGAFADALEIADRQDGAAGPGEPGPWSTLRMWTLAAAGHDQLATDLASMLTAALEADPAGRRAHVFMPCICSFLLARAGRLDEADRGLRAAERGLQRPEHSLEIAWVRTAIRYECGARGDALAHFADLQTAFDRSANLVGIVWTRAYVGRILLLLGRRRDAVAVLSEARALCQAKQAFGLQRIVELAYDEDPLAAGWLSRNAAVPTTKVGESVRAQLRSLLRYACTNEGALIQSQRLDLAVPDDADYAFDRALLELARAVQRARQGRIRVAATHLGLARRRAAECNADPDLIPTLYAQLRSESAREPPGTTAAASDPAVVIDGVRHEIADRHVRVSLASRVVLRQLVYAFAAADGYFLDRNAITRALWSCDYAPLRHESSVKSNIQRLRTLLDETRLTIHTERDGYRLSVPPGSVIVPPCARQ